ncbi:zinc finger domain-containing ubiquitin ligase [Gigaspora margarita]|uniref:Zinc finger domain-containing ubiquitin ligase n=1 Tax=Gigaspora margarita TaxID=4874 RepID=A0A8H4AZ02_GIGMA|nr:zinc finger domain-containing ubiquitin ligase [Gigaspora margarita]
MPPPTQQQGQNSWLSRFTSLVITSSVVRYGTLIFLVALISVLYFATTHQVMKTSGANASISVSYMSIDNSTTNAQISSDSGNDDIPPFDKGLVNQIGDYKSGNNKGLLYDRGDGCNSNLNKSKQGFIPSGIRTIGLVSLNNCTIDEKINNSIKDADTGLIIYLTSSDTNKYDNITNINLLVFTVVDSDHKLLNELRNLSNINRDKSNNLTEALRVTLVTAQPVPVNSWLFAMFAVGGILVTSFFISILIHMRLYRLRRNHQEEIRRQRAADDITGMRKWTLDQEDIDLLRVFIYSKKTKESRKSTEITKIDDKDNSATINEVDEKNSATINEVDEKNSGDKPNGDVDAKESSTESRSLSHKSSVRSTRSTKSTRSQKAINNAVSLYTSTDSTQNPAGSDNDMALEETCAICLEDFEDGDKIRELPCHHCYHVECIDPWLTTKSSSCPLCKKDCKPSIGGNTSISVNIENERQATQPVTNQDSTNANNPNVMLRIGRLFRGYFSSRNEGRNNSRNIVTNSLENENGMELENVRTVN